MLNFNNFDDAWAQALRQAQKFRQPVQVAELKTGGYVTGEAGYLAARMPEDTVVVATAKCDPSREKPSERASRFD